MFRLTKMMTEISGLGVVKSDFKMISQALSETTELTIVLYKQKHK